MKSIIYILLAAILSSMALTSCPKSASKQNQVIQLQCVEQANQESLNQSCSIIKQRLSDYGIKDYDVSVNANQNMLEVTLSQDIDYNEILPLLTSKGEIEFFETYNRSDVIKLLSSDSKLISLLIVPQNNNDASISPATLGFCNEPNIATVDSCLATHNFEDIKFAWSKASKSDEIYSLYLLKTPAAINKSLVSKTAVRQSKQFYNELLITFNKEGSLIFQNISKSNLNKPLAIVIDNKVYSAPIVRSEIKGGNCAITGNFTLNELNVLKALINNQSLPITFKVLK